VKPLIVPSPDGTTVPAVRDTSLGKILVDSQGRSLYLFKKDTGPKSTRYGSCAVAWPPFTTSGTPKAGSGAKASLIGTTTRTDGKDLNQFGAAWYVLSPAGDQIGH
jgi:predicted lipoprotein with Yx(FWY)xxD motif